nr:hypothetical protein [uncultured Roseococcus sp.]
MSILLAFLPFLVFAVVDRTIGATEGLVAGAVTSLGMLARDVFIFRASPKILEIGTVLLFGGLAAYAVFGSPDWSLMEVRLRVDLGLLAIVLASLAVRRPFTMQYARESVPRELWNSPEFIRANDVITAVWAMAFFVMVLADLALIFMPSIRPAVGILATVAALVGAVKFTNWYPNRTKP